MTQEQIEHLNLVFGPLPGMEEAMRAFAKALVRKTDAEMMALMAAPARPATGRDSTNIDRRNR